MRTAVYNLAIPNDISNPLSCTLRFRPCHSFATQLACAVLGLVVAAHGADWSGPEQQLARKILAVTGPVSLAVAMENRSSLGRRDSEIVQNGLRSALLVLGVRFVKNDQAAASVAITLSENVASYVWVARIRQGTQELAVAMVAVPRTESAAVPTHESVPLVLRKVSLWAQSDPILDVAVLEEGATPTRIAVLGGDKCFALPIASGTVVSGTGDRHRTFSALAAGLARQAGACEGSWFRCLSPRRYLSQYGGRIAFYQLPR